MEFGARCKEAKGRLTLVAQEIRRLVGVILNEHQLIQKKLQAAKSHERAFLDMRTQCEWLLSKGFILRLPYERMQHLPRYLRAVGTRLEKIEVDAIRDARQFTQIQSLQQAWQRKLDTQKGNVDPRLEEFGWLLQELRVSLFAQELKTPVIVSTKRLEKLWSAM